MLLKFIFIMAFVSWLSVARAADQPKQLTGNDLKTATQMNDMYARHMYSSSCMDRQKALYLPNVLTPAEKAARIEGYKKSCDCMTSTVLESFPPNDLIGYVGDMNGAFPPGVTVRPKPDPVVVKKYAQIAAINRDKENRQKCGFKQ